MFDAADSLATWVALALAGTAFLGAALALPTAPPPDAAALAEAVDAVAASEHDATATREVAADEVRVGPHRVALRSDGGTAGAAFVARVTPVRPDTRLAAVLRDGDPESVFSTPGAFLRAASSARNRTSVWRTADTLHVRHVTWREVDVVLVG